MTTVNLSHPVSGELGATIYATTSTQIIGGFEIPPDAATGPWRLNVTTFDGGPGMKPSAFTVNKVLPPTITSLRPPAGYRNTTVAFILTGANFQPGGRTQVFFTNITGGIILETELKVVYPTQISGRVEIPAGTETGSWNVNVTTIDGGSFEKKKVLTIQ